MDHNTIILFLRHKIFADWTSVSRFVSVNFTEQNFMLKIECLEINLCGIKYYCCEHDAFQELDWISACA